MSDKNSIDADELIYMPLACLEGMISELDANAPGTDFVLTVVRWAAVLLICGQVIPKGASMQTGVRRGIEMLAILQAYAKNRPLN